MTQPEKSDSVTITLARDVAEFWLEYTELQTRFMLAVGELGGIKWRRRPPGEIEAAIREALSR